MKKKKAPTNPARESFGYPEIHDNAEMALMVEEGVPVDDVMDFARQAGYTTEELAAMLQIPPRTYARRVAAKALLQASEAERAVRWMRLYDLAKRLFVTHENTRGWLNAKLPALGGRTPLQFGQTEPGAREVENLIGRLEHGVYS